MAGQTMGTTVNQIDVTIAVSSRSKWEDVLAVKTKVELLLECYHKVVSNGNMGDHTPAVLGQGDRREKKRDETTEEEFQEFGYSAVKDWSALTSVAMQRRFGKWERQYLTGIKRMLLPLVSQLIQSMDTAQDRQEIVSLLRATCAACNIATRPIYLDSGSRGTE